MDDQNQATSEETGLSAEQRVKLVSGALAGVGVIAIIVGGLFLEGIYFEKQLYVGGAILGAGLLDLVMAWLFFNGTIKIQ
ncbi:MAG: hypothetical protein AAF213_08465 [Pseudomonadota bacterium]